MDFYELSGGRVRRSCAPSASERRYRLRAGTTFFNGGWRV